MRPLSAVVPGVSILSDQTHNMEMSDHDEVGVPCRGSMPTFKVSCFPRCISKQGCLIYSSVLSVLAHARHIITAMNHTSTSLQ